MDQGKQADKACIKASFLHNVRLDGRANYQFKRIWLSLSVLNNCLSSVQILNDDNHVIIGVRAEVFTSSPEIDQFIHLDVMSIVGTSTLKNYPNISRASDSHTSVSTKRLEKLKHLMNTLSIDLIDGVNKTLAICEGFFNVHLFIDVIVLKAGGSLDTVTSIGLATALKTCKIPEFVACLKSDRALISSETLQKINESLLQKIGQEQINKRELYRLRVEYYNDITFTVQPNKWRSLGFSNKVPIIISAGVFGNEIIVDLNANEESSVDSIVCISCDAKGDVLGLEAFCKKSLNPLVIEQIKKIARNASEMLFENYLSDKNIDTYASSEVGILNIFNN